MSLTSSDISRIANLARLELYASGSERMLSQLNDFFDIVQKMRAVDTTGVVPLAHPFETIGDIALRLREDVASEPDQREANQRSAPSVEAGLFLVIKVIEEERHRPSRTGLAAGRARTPLPSWPHLPNR